MNSVIVLFCLVVLMTGRATALRVRLGGVSTLSRNLKPGILGGPRHQRQLHPIIHSPLKLPVWPIWSGVIAQVADWVGLHSVVNTLVNTVGGRVIPMQLLGFETSPFLMLVHHSHSFSPFDPFRYLTRLLLPEGFPAHPHAGFDTGTVLKYSTIVGNFIPFAT